MSSTNNSPITSLVPTVNQAPSTQAGVSSITDLSGFFFNVLPDFLTPGQQFSLDLKFQNSGFSNSGPFEVQFYLSTNNTITTNDVLLGSATYSNLSGPVISPNFVATLSLPDITNAIWQNGDGDYHIGMVIDPRNVISESNENNNASVALLFDYDIVTVTNTQPLPDLSANYFNVLQEPLNAGNNFLLDYEILNTGGALGQNFSVSFYLSTNDIISSADQFLGSTTLSGLGANSTTGLLTQNLTLPGINDLFWNGDGTYHIGMLIDSGNQITESNEANNSNTGWLIDYDDVIINNTTAADLKGSQFDVIIEPLNAGDTFAFNYTVDNLGGRTNQPVEVAFYLSSNNFISTSDLLLGTTTLNSLSAFSSTGNLTQNLTLPGINNAFWSGDGTYHVGMIIDPNNKISELNESNNSNTGWLDDYDDVVINNTTAADLKASQFDVIVEPLSAGDTFSFNYTVDNLGGHTNQPVQVQFYLSNNSTISQADVLLGSTTLNALSANSTTGSLTTNLTLPGINDSFWTGNGTYYIGMILDPNNTISELNENNNSNTGWLLDYDDVLINNTVALGTRDNDDFFGSATKDMFSGLRGDDNIYGANGNDRLYGDHGDDWVYGEGGDDEIYGDHGDDLVVGGTGSDFVYGGYGDDILIGVNDTLLNAGSNEIDTLTGGYGADIFVLGDETEAYYTDAISADYAIITDFNSNEDTIVLHGSVGQYRSGAPAAGVPAGVGIFDQNNEMVAVVQGTSTLNLTSNNFIYV